MGPIGPPGPPVAAKSLVMFLFCTRHFRALLLETVVRGNKGGKKSFVVFLNLHVVFWGMQRGDVGIYALIHLQEGVGIIQEVLQKNGCKGGSLYQDAWQNGREQ